MANADGFSVGVTGKLFAEIVLLVAIWWIAIWKMDRYAMQEWLWESWRFVKQIIPLLIAGVFFAGVARSLIPVAWIEAIAGRNTLWANLVPVIFAVFIYFPTLVEVRGSADFPLARYAPWPAAGLLCSPTRNLVCNPMLVTSTIIRQAKDCCICDHGRCV